MLIACPGRLEDLIQQGFADLSQVEITVLDEADHMADLGFLPAVRRLLDATPRNGQRMLFSATLDNAVGVLVKRFLTDPAVHEADSAQSPVSQMDHHVLHLPREQRVPVLVDLTSAPGRTVVFTRTKHGAKALARQLNSRGVPTVELHGNLAQNARTRNMEAFHSGRATTLVATDIAARGIHVDDVTLVVHADPPAEHKAYLHRSGRTARAGAAGTVVTLMTDQQVRDVRDLTRAAGIKPTVTKIPGPAHALLRDLAPGERTLVEGGLVDERPQVRQGGGSGDGSSRPQGAGGGRRRRSGAVAPAVPAARAAPAAHAKGGARRSGGAGGGQGRPARAPVPVAAAAVVVPVPRRPPAARTARPTSAAVAPADPSTPAAAPAPAGAVARLRAGIAGCRGRLPPAHPRSPRLPGGPMNLRNLPTRLAVGAFVLHSGMEKWSGDEEQAQALHGMASGTYPGAQGRPAADLPLRPLGRRDGRRCGAARARSCPRPSRARP